MNEAGKACIIGDVGSLSYMLSLVIPEEYREKFREDVKSGKKISIQRCGNSFEMAHEENGCIQYRTAVMPYGVELFPHDDKYDWQADEYDYILFLFSWPFNAKTQLDRLGNLNLYMRDMKDSIGVARFKAVLYNDAKQRTAISDLETKKETLDKAKQIIADKLKEFKLAELVECVAVNTVNDFELLFSGEDNGLSGVNKITEKKLRTISSSIEYFHSEYKLKQFISDFDVVSLDKMAIYDAVGNTDNLNLKYWNNLRNSSVWSRFCDNLKNLYKEKIVLYSIWNIERDVEQLINLINSRAQYDIVDTVSKTKFTGSELEYGSSNAVINCKINFYKNIQKMVEETVPNIIVEKLEAKEKLYFPDK